MAKTLTSEEHISLLHNFVLVHKNQMAFSLVMRKKNGDLKIYNRPSQPCYGELRTYSENEYRPSDLKHPFPKYGKPVGLGVSFSRHPEQETRQLLLKTMLLPDSPWSSIFNNCEHELVIDHNGSIVGIVMLNTKFNPTHFVQFLILQRSYDLDFFKRLMYMGFKDNYALLLPLVVHPDSLHSWRQVYGCGMKVMLSRWVNSNPIDVAPGVFYNRTAYSRDYMDYQWGSDDVKPLAQVFKERGTPTHLTSERIVPTITSILDELVETGQ